MHQVTIVFMDSEIAYGEGESRGYAFDEASENIPEEYEQHLEHLTVIILSKDKRLELSFDDALKLMH